jgi:glycerol-3-phosphate dehydrogenase
VASFVDSLGRALPAFAWSGSRVRRVFWGVLPVEREATVELTARPDVVSHREALGLHSVVAIKFTTAPQVARHVLERIFGPKLPPARATVPQADGSRFTEALLDGDRAAQMERAQLLALIESVAREEAVLDADDLLLRRTNWLFTAKEPERLRATAEEALQGMHPTTTVPLAKTLGVR